MEALRPLVIVALGAVLATACGLTDPTTVEPGDTTAPGPTTTIETSCPPDAPPAPEPCVVLVPDPRAGDLRVDADADVLPVDYEPSPAAAVIPGVSYGPDDEHRLDLHLPATTPAPVVVFLHSGGWIGGSRTNVPPMVLRFVELGYAVASVDYRLAPDHAWPAPLEDVKRSIHWLRTDDLALTHIDPARMVLYGTSAGGHLAAMAATTPGRFEPADLDTDDVTDAIAAIVSVVGPTDLTTFYTTPHEWAVPLTEALLGCSPCRDEQLEAASVHPYLGEDLPPAYWAYAEQDCLVEPDTQGEAIAARWAAFAPPDSSLLDLIESCDHNVDHSLINQRWVEAFVQTATAEDAP